VKNEASLIFGGTGLSDIADIRPIIESQNLVTQDTPHQNSVGKALRLAVEIEKYGTKVSKSKREMKQV
jgi:hypothetical protein